MEVSKIKKALIEQKNIGLSGNLYHKTQLDFTYNTNHIEGSTITPDETASIYDTGTILTSKDKVIVLKDATETKNHFTLFKYMLDTIDDKLTEDMIKKFHFILKDGTLTDSEKEWFNVGEYKKKKTLLVILQHYIRGIKEYQTNNEKGYLIDTCLNSQDNYETMANYFLEDNE